LTFFAIAADPHVAMMRLLLVVLCSLRSALRSHADLAVENLALRQQLASFAKTARRPRISGADRWFWIILRRFWTRWLDVLVFVKPETVVRWHRAGFRCYWTWLSRRQRRGRPAVDAELRALIRKMATENPTFGAPRIHGELASLGFDGSERTVRGTCLGVHAVPTPSSGGSSFSATTAMRSPRWTSSSSRR